MIFYGFGADCLQFHNNQKFLQGFIGSPFSINKSNTQNLYIFSPSATEYESLL